MSIQVLHRDDLELGGFEGIREHRIVMNPKIFGSITEAKTWPGLGSFVYLADAKFIPNGETKLHPHKEVDIISVMIDGRISHKGSLEDGTTITSNQVQVQRAGGEGFAHNEVNPDDKENRMLQIWAMPEKSGEPSGYKLYNLKQDQMIRVYGGEADQDEFFSSDTVIEIGLLSPNQKIKMSKNFLAYVAKGNGIVDGQKISEGDLVKGNDEIFESTDNSELILISKLD